MTEIVVESPSDIVSVEIAMAAHTARKHGFSEIADKLNEIAVSLLIPQVPPIAEQVMVFVKGTGKQKQSFRCECNCNVFSRMPGNKYRCNSCGALYDGERE